MNKNLLRPGAVPAAILRLSGLRTLALSDNGLVPCRVPTFFQYARACVLCGRKDGCVYESESERGLCVCFCGHAQSFPAHVPGVYAQVRESTAVSLTTHSVCPCL
jgi:hypothetical protein